MKVTNGGRLVKYIILTAMSVIGGVGAFMMELQNAKECDIPGLETEEKKEES